ncbi:MAG: urease accessory UreF family protein [Pseudomonadota bacterium]
MATIRTLIATPTAMTDGFSHAQSLALVRVMAWLSPAFPTGGFAYSSGLEAAVQAGFVSDEASLAGWVNTNLKQGSLQLDAKFLSLAHNAGCHSAGAQSNAGVEEIRELQNLAAAFAGNSVRWRETTAQGAAFLSGLDERAEFSETDVRVALSLDADTDSPLPVAIGAATAHGGVARPTAILAFLQAAIGQQLSAAIRLNLIGQNGAARLLDRLEKPIVEAMEAALDCTQDELTAATPIADVLAAQHEILDSRLFLS